MYILLITRTNTHIHYTQLADYTRLIYTKSHIHTHIKHLTHTQNLTPNTIF